MKYGMRGYGIYWAIIEMLRDESNYKMRLQCERIAFELHEDIETIKSVIQDFGLFVVEADLFWSESLLRRMDFRDQKSKKARESALYRWNKGIESESDANALQKQSEGNAIKERKVKESKENEIETFVFPSDSDDLQNTTKMVAEYFGISEMYHPAHFIKIGNFCRYMEISNKTEYFKKQFLAYKKFKDKNGYKHSWTTYIGSVEKSYEDGSWNKQDWSKDDAKASNVVSMPKRLNRNPQ
jgi:hypothetical protein